MPRIIIDPESSALAERVALIRTRRTDRARYPEGCVTIVTDEALARASAAPEAGLHAAVVYGPSTSSEGQRLYYLVRWIE
ncbi:MAG: hypothetical protein EOM91_07710 [Sphingobacteriia bacterium]|nr:hypothetical protein [Sphingobacteriia bacterium]NCC40007.1 hypothetical protein [Gammaproteobacteria bacterium]